jgi:hypothetical protein
MRRIREILLTQYIGAIVIGVVIAQALMRAVGLLMEPVLWYQQGRPSGSALDSSPMFPFSRMVSPALTVILYFVVSYLLLVWLYGAESMPMPEGESTENPERQS